MIIITGNRRSGTSLTAKILHTYGLDFGKGRYHENEVRGGYENVKIMKFNRRLSAGAVDKGIPNREWKDVVRKHGSNMRKAAEKLPYVKNPQFVKVLESWILAGCKIGGVILILRDYKDTAESVKMNIPVFYNDALEDVVLQQAAEIGYVINIMEYYEIPYCTVYYPRDFVGDDALCEVAEFLKLNQETLSSISNALYNPNINYKTKTGKMRR